MIRDPWLVELYRRTRIATSFPPRPRGGFLVYRTDVTNPELFFYEAARAKWLSVRTIELYFSARSALAAGSWLETTAVVTTSATMGYIAAHDMTLVELEAVQGGNATSGIAYQLFDDGTAVAQVSVLASTSSATHLAQNVDIAQGSILGAKNASEAVNPPAVFVARLRRHAT